MPGRSDRLQVQNPYRKVEVPSEGGWGGTRSNSYEYVKHMAFEQGVEATLSALVSNLDEQIRASMESERHKPKCPFCGGKWRTDKTVKGVDRE